MAELAVGVDVQVPRHADRTCMFFEPASAGACAVHREMGEHALPSACRHFPREFLVDGRGTLVSLSHYCPTAAQMLSSPRALDVVNGESLRIGGAVEGLDATAALPPLLRPGLLTDLDGYAAWEHACLATLSREQLTAARGLDLIEEATGTVCEWQPGTVSLHEAVTAAFGTLGVGPAFAAATAGKPGSGRDMRERSLAAAFAPLVAQHIAHEALPVADYETTWQPLVEGSPEIERIAKNYLGARLFGNWIAYQGRGLLTVVEWLRACHAVLRNEMALRCMRERRPATPDDAIAAAGRADLLLVHTIDSQAFARFFA